MQRSARVYRIQKKNLDSRVPTKTGKDSAMEFLASQAVASKCFVTYCRQHEKWFSYAALARAHFVSVNLEHIMLERNSRAAKCIH